MRKLVALVTLAVLLSSASAAQQKTLPSQDDLPAAPIKDADLFQATAHQDGAATDYIYNYLESRDGAVWSVVCIGRAGADSACHVFHKGERALLYAFRKPQRVKTGRFSSSKAIVGKVCGAESGCFLVQITHISGATGQPIAQSIQ
jgi:hypothetical protein